ncbi:MAG: BTAD domain-containing putative transcriptional regulator [Microbacterium sp.]
MSTTITGPGWTVTLLGQMRIECAGRTIHLPHRQQRLVALLALRSVMHRRVVAATLWPDSADAKAGLSVRATLHQINENARGLVECVGDEVRLGTATVDADALCQCAGQVEAGRRTPPASRATLVRGALLPGWDEEWLEEPRAHLERHRLAALESASAAQLVSGNSVDAIDLAERAVASDPLCESAHYLIVQGHLAAGNRARAMMAYRRLVETLRRELDIRPSLAFEDVASVVPVRRFAGAAL